MDFNFLPMLVTIHKKTGEIKNSTTTHGGEIFWNDPK